MFLCLQVDQSRGDYMLREIFRAAIAAGGQVAETMFTLTAKDVADKPLQFVRALYRYADNIIKHFDVDPCRVALWYDAARGWQVIASSTFLRTLQLRAYFVTSWMLTATGAARMVKYRKYGFTPCLPGIDRAAAWRRIARRMSPQSLDYYCTKATTSKDFKQVRVQAAAKFRTV